MSLGVAVCCAERTPQTVGHRVRGGREWGEQRLRGEQRQVGSQLGEAVDPRAVPVEPGDGLGGGDEGVCLYAEAGLQPSERRVERDGAVVFIQAPAEERRERREKQFGDRDDFYR